MSLSWRIARQAYGFFSGSLFNQDKHNFTGKTSTTGRASKDQQRTSAPNTPGGNLTADTRGSIVELDNSLPSEGYAWRSSVLIVRINIYIYFYSFSECFYLISDFRCTKGLRFISGMVTAFHITDLWPISTTFIITPYIPMLTCQKRISYTHATRWIFFWFNTVVHHITRKAHVFEVKSNHISTWQQTTSPMHRARLHLGLLWEVRARARVNLYLSQAQGHLKDRGVKQRAPQPHRLQMSATQTSPRPRQLRQRERGGERQHSCIWRKITRHLPLRAEPSAVASIKSNRRGKLSKAPERERERENRKKNKSRWVKRHWGCRNYTSKKLEEINNDNK